MKLQFTNAIPQDQILDGALIPADLLGGDLMTDSDFDKTVASGGFFPRVQLCSANSKVVQEDKIKGGNFGLILTKDSVEDLTRSFTCIPLAYAMKAMQILDGSVTSVFDHTAAAFKEIQAKSEEQDSGCMWGVDFLVYIPENKTFGTYYLSSKTARKEAKPLRGLIGQATTITSTLIKGKKFNWFGPVVSKSSVPVEVPPAEIIRENVEKFRALCKVTTKEPTQPTEGQGERER